jgi:hypothetical protein
MTAVNVDLATPTVQKDKDATKTYVFDVTGLLAPGDQLASCDWVVSTPGVTLGSQSNGPLMASVQVSGGTPLQWYAVVGTYTTVLGDVDQIVLRIFIEADREDLSALGSDLFPNRFTAVAALRRDRLLTAAAGALGTVDVSDDYLWDKLTAAEASVRHTLRVPFRLTQFFSDTPTTDDLAALPTGMPWDIDPGYDYEPDFFRSESWGYMQLRHKPLDSVQDVRILFPAAPATTFYRIPDDWVRLEKKYATIQFIPQSGSGSVPLNAFMLQAIGMGRRIPFSIKVSYRSGIVASDWPDLLDVVQKKAVLMTLEDRFLPQSGSMSADGLSQSVSFDMEKYRDTIDSKLNGPKGSNGGLMAALHGVRGMVV